MAVSALEIKSRSALAGGTAFGEVGAYEQLDGIAHFRVDPGHICNEAITDLKLAPGTLTGWWSAPRTSASSDQSIRGRGTGGSYWTCPTGATAGRCNTSTSPHGIPTPARPWTPETAS